MAGAPPDPGRSAPPPPPPPPPGLPARGRRPDRTPGSAKYLVTFSYVLLCCHLRHAELPRVGQCGCAGQVGQDHLGRLGPRGEEEILLCLAVPVLLHLADEPGHSVVALVLLAVVLVLDHKVPVLEEEADIVRDEDRGQLEVKLLGGRVVQVRVIILAQGKPK